MNPLHITGTLGLALLLAACGQKADTNAPGVANQSLDMVGNMNVVDNEHSTDMGNIAMSDSGIVKMVKGTGTVTAIDKATGTIKLDHGQIPAANWAAHNGSAHVCTPITNAKNVS